MANDGQLDLQNLRARISRIVNTSLDEVEKTLRSGTPAAKASVMKTTLPALIKVLGEEEKADELSEMRRIVSEIAERDRMRISGMEAKDGAGDDANGPSTEGNPEGQSGSGAKVVRLHGVDLPTDMSGTSG